VYAFDPDDRLAGKKIYYDRRTVLRQLSIFYEPRSLLAQFCIFATHPATTARPLARKLLRTGHVSRKLEIRINLIGLTSMPSRQMDGILGARAE
jgi:hypothetical protein